VGVLGADGGGCDLPFEESERVGGGISGSSMSWRLITPFSVPLLFLSFFSCAYSGHYILSLFLSTLSPPSLQFCGFPAGHGSPPTIATALDGFAAIS